jgi:transcriptional regulator of acetoin/glycerol metabolism
MAHRDRPFEEHGAPTAAAMRPEIALSWRRSSSSGLLPGTRLDTLDITEFDRGSRFLTAVAPVVDTLLSDLGGAPVCVVVADHDARLVRVGSGDTALLRRLENVGAIPGRQFVEAATGTNSIATAYEARGRIAVRGEEHFVESLRQFACYGQSVVHPATRRIAGVLSFVCRAGDDDPMMVPFLRHLVRDLEQRILDGARLRERRMLGAFLDTAGRRGLPVLAVGPDVTLASPGLSERLSPADHARLASLAAELPAGGSGSRPLRLESGVTVDVGADSVAGVQGGVVFELRPADPPARVLAVPALPARHNSGPSALHRFRERRASVLITGESGTGRTGALRDLAGSAGLTVLEACRAAGTDNGAGWLERLERSAARERGLLAVEDIHLLSDETARQVRRVLDSTASWFALTGAPLVFAAETLSPELAGLATLCTEHLRLPPLRERTVELPDLLAARLRAAGAHASVRFTAAAMAQLTAYSWPGNLTELDAVVRHALHRRTAGDITAADLPERCRDGVAARRLGALEQAEYEVITGALRASNGNKVRAAQALGISRTTLYNRMRALRIPG